MIENIVAVFDRASQDDVEDGINWYPSAQRFALEHTDNILIGAGVISALSPLKSWNLNLRLAANALDSGIATGHTGMQNAKANAIMALGDNANKDDILKILGGDKTKSFFLNIVNPWGDAVTIDRHAYDIALNKVHSDKDRRIGKIVYRALSAEYIDAAAICGVFPLELQAITWTTWRREKGIK